jgi:hypothetical protein
MSDVGWGSDHLEPPKKRKIPMWILGCGGGCMFLIGAMIVASLLLGPKVKRWFDNLSTPEVQWPELAEVLPYDAVPAGVTIERWPMPVWKIWKLEARSKDLFAFVFSAPKGDDKGPWGVWVLDPKQAPMFAAQDGSFECSEGTLLVQGRELRSVRFMRTNMPPPADVATEKPADPVDSSPDAMRIEDLLGRETIRGSGLDVVITTDDSPRVVLMWLVRGKQGETVTDEDAREFLAPFKIGTDR